MLLTYPQVAERLGISISKVFDLVARGILPQPINIGERSSRFLVEEIDDYIKTRAAERPTSDEKESAHHG